jgi:acylphosphatase
MSNVRVHLKIEGRVQGVWFRESTRKKAQSLGVLGWVRNRSDGTVEAMAEGEEDKVKALVSWCHQGPPSAQVTRVSKAWDEWQDEFNSFDVVF